MLKFYGDHQPPDEIGLLRLGGRCPHCHVGTRFSRTTEPITAELESDNIQAFVLSYTCELCLGPIPVQWEITGWYEGEYGEPIMVVDNPKVILPTREEFDFQYVPENVRKEIEEALDCLSVNAYNGFAAVCRRAIQVACTHLGAGAKMKVKRQIEEMIQLTGLGGEWQGLAFQIMLSGHDGAHPHLPEVNAERSIVLLSLLRDLIYELYTRTGKVREAAILRQQVIKDQKSGGEDSEALDSQEHVISAA